jgi:hypothetical protein
VTPGPAGLDEPFPTPLDRPRRAADGRSEVVDWDAWGYTVAIDDVARLITKDLITAKDFYTYRRIILRQDKILRDHGGALLN